MEGEQNDSILVMGPYFPKHLAKKHSNLSQTIPCKFWMKRGQNTKKSVRDTDSLIGKSNNDGSIISESQATGSTIDDGEIVGESIAGNWGPEGKKEIPIFTILNQE